MSPSAAALSGWLACLQAAGAGSADSARGWLDDLLSFPYAEPAQTEPVLALVRQDFERLERNRSILATPLAIGERRFEHGLGTHSVSHLRVGSPEPIDRFSAWIGVDRNERTAGERGSVVFSIERGDEELFRSRTLTGRDPPDRVEIEAGGASALDLHVGDAGDGPGWDHADWAEAAITLRSGRTFRLDELALRPLPFRGSRYPFSFTFGGRPSDELLAAWRRDDGTEQLDAARTSLRSTWTDPATGLRVSFEAVRFADFPALEWLLRFENGGARDTPLLEGVQAMDLTLAAPLTPETPYRLHRSKGAPADPSDFEPRVVSIGARGTATLSAGGGRSSNRDFPFFKVEAGDGSLVAAVGWSGQWAAALHSPDGHHLRLTAGLETTRFKLLPGEKVRTPRILLLRWGGDTLESNAQFRQLLYRHHSARRSGQPQLPTLFLNTCFTRGGGWLNECNAENQISLIRAFAPLGLEALITDAGWFEGGWPAGAGNWTARKDAYPAGMGPVAAAARRHGMVYGLWFEPERVVAGTALHRERPDWLLGADDPGATTLLADFGRREVQDFFFEIVRGFMDLPGFRFYRQDFNLDPLSFWRRADAPDRQGVTEMRYVEGLYAYWDRIAAAWPDGLREECASGGRRIDLETIRRMPLHQKSDYWFDADVDQSSLWSLSQYLPNNLITVPIQSLDDYSFHSALASSLIPGWIADAPEFDLARAKRLLDRYRAVRHLLVGAWYPLLPWSSSPRDWMASQYHRPDLEEGLVLAFRRAESPFRSVELSLHGLDAEAEYEVTSDRTGERNRVAGARLMKSFEVTLPERRSSNLITYRRIAP